MRFTKMQGAGNDYIYVDCISNPPPRDPAGLSKAISDRHFGVGADGLILICPSERADAWMRMFNADGSEAEMCGNGVRCVAKYVYDHGLVRKPRLTIETGRGVLTLDLDIKNGIVQRVTVDMGEPILEAAKIPTTLPGNPPINVPLVLLDFMETALLQLASPGGKPLVTEQLRVTCVSMGNPHCVTYVDEVTDLWVLGVGPQIEQHPAFLRKVNAEFVKVNRPDDVTMRVWERGSGETLACGTGACAVCVAGVLTGRTARRITAHLPGGDLELHWNEADKHVYMTGPAVEVFQG